MNQNKNLEQVAIDAAINSNWDEAIKINQEIIKKDKNNLEAYLRLGFAYLQKNNIKKAKSIYQKAKKIQPDNHLIIENLEKIKILESKKINFNQSANLNPYLFLDIPGKTKSVALVNLGQKAILASLSIGQEVNLLIKKRRIEIRTKNKEYIGCLPDDLSKRLIIFIKAGSRFSCIIKEASLKEVIVFLKEEKKGKKVARYASFPLNIQNNLTNINSETNEEKTDEETEEISDIELEKLAESLLTEDKEYFSYENIKEDEEEDYEE